MLSIATNEQSHIYLLIILGLIVSFAWFALRSQSSSNLSLSSTKNKLLRLFSGSYQEDAELSGNEVIAHLTAQESEIPLIDGANTKAWAYNGTVPGPEIKANIGDTVKVTLQNNLPSETTIHWHGVRVPNAMDGVPGVTQDPIAIGESFTYEFIPKDAGTFWFHPHVRGAEQVERGLYGTLIVTDPDDPKYDQDLTLVVDDWRLTPDGQVDPRFVTNGDLMHDGRWGSYLTVNGKKEEVIKLRPRSTNRLRFINTSNARVYKLDFGSLAAVGVAVDGMKASQEFNPQGFELSPGNRIDVIVSIPENGQDLTYLIRDTFTRNANTLLSVVVGGDIVAPTKETMKMAYIPDWSEAAKLEPDKEYLLNAKRSMGKGIEWTINGKAFPDYDPITLKYNTFNKIRFTNQSSRLHPMHLHGQFFKVIARNGVVVSEPYWRDTVLVHAKETVDIALVPLDKGRWVNHCHILEHAEAGMLTVVEVK